VAHRLASIERADEVLVMDQGRVAERGAFAALLKQGGLFTRLYQLQFRPPLQTL
jgi:ATP-binding cassette, subfamily B, bacterial